MQTNKREIFGFIPAERVIPFSLVTMLFLLWGIPNNLNDVLIRQFMKSFEIDRFRAGLIQSAFYMGYFLLAIPSGLFMKRFSYKAGLVSGLCLFSIGCLLFWPAALIGRFPFFLFALFVIAAGLTFLETGANIFIVQVGATRSAERRLNFSQAFNPIGAVLGVLIGTIFIFSGIELSPAEVDQLKASGGYDAYLQHEIMRVVWPYLILAVFGLVWAALIVFSRFPEIRQEESRGPSARGGIRKLFAYPHFKKGVVSQFLYCGAQTCTWSFFIQYMQDYTFQPEKVAGYFLTGTLAAFGAGRFSATYLMRFTRPGKLMGLFGMMNMLLIGVAIVYPGWVGVWAVFLTSFFMSLMYPTNFALSIKGLGEHTKIGGSVMVMAIVGGAVFPPLMGLLAESTGMAFAMVVPLLAYAYITYFGFKGSRFNEAGAADD